MRCLLVENDGRLILIDNGMGDKQDEKFISRYSLDKKYTLEGSLKKHGFSPDDITDLFLTHLHFDHCGGSVKINRDGSGFETVFKNAIYWTNKNQWQLAIKPNSREKASFLNENIMPIMESGQLRFVEREGELYPDFHVKIFHGHTASQMIPFIKLKGRTVVFMADLVPSTAHISLPWNMSYDTQPLVTLIEKEKFLEKAAEEEYILFLEHDSFNECCTVTATDKGIKLKDKFNLNDVF
jgi:glyoxylase-like metal-dependent hydrolase (beta-lactamase superfamily II)